MTPPQPDGPDGPVEIVVLDVDGTLVDSTYQHAVAWAIGFRAVGVQVPTWRIHRAIGMGADKLVAHVADDAVEEHMGDEIRDAHAREYANLHGSVTVLPGAEGIVSAFTERGLKVVLATSSSAEDFEREAELFDDIHMAEAVLTLGDVEETKPAPDLIRRAVEAAGGGRAVAIGDSPWDVKAAAELEVATIGLLTGGFCEAELLDAGAAEVYPSLQQLRDDVEKSLLGRR